jgi:hypothetical protein
MLPPEYEPLLLTFHEPRIVAGATVIGTDYGTEFRLVDAAIISVDPAQKLPKRFVNSSVGQLAACLAAHAEYCCGIDAAHCETDELAMVESFTAAIRRIDYDCLSNPENWWAVIIRQMRDGQL